MSHARCGVRCAACDTALPEGANYCWQCGTAQGPGAVDAAPPDDAASWEVCEIVPRLVAGGPLRRTWQFQALATGPDGPYRAGASPPFATRGHDLVDGWRHPAAAHALETLALRLAEGGWEPRLRGPLWYSYRFRRRAAPAAQRPEDAAATVPMRRGGARQARPDRGCLLVLAGLLIAAVGLGLGSHQDWQATAILAAVLVASVGLIQMRRALKA